MFTKKPSHRIFDYSPRFYNPDEDKVEQRKKRLKFRYSRNYKKRTKSPVIWLALLLAILYFYMKFQGIID